MYWADTTLPIDLAGVSPHGWTSPTNAAVLPFRLSFSKAVVNLTAAAFDFANGGTGCSLQPASFPLQPCVICDFAAGGCVRDGSIRIALRAVGSGVADLQGHALSPNVGPALVVVRGGLGATLAISTCLICWCCRCDSSRVLDRDPTPFSATHSGSSRDVQGAIVVCFRGAKLATFRSTSRNPSKALVPQGLECWRTR